MEKVKIQIVWNKNHDAAVNLLPLSKAFDNRRRFDEALKEDKARAEYALGLLAL
jgi:hypothetical protein